MKYKIILYSSLFFLTQILFLFLVPTISLAQYCQNTGINCCYINPVNGECTDYTTPGSCNSSCNTPTCPAGTQMMGNPTCYWSGGATPPPGGGGGGGGGGLEQ